MKSRLCFILLLLFATANSFFIAQETEEAKEIEAQEQLKQLKSEYRTAYKSFLKAIEGKNAKEQHQFYLENPPEKNVWSKFAKFANDYIGTNASFDALEWMIHNRYGSSTTQQKRDKNLQQALNLVCEYYANHPNLKKFLWSSVFSIHPNTAKPFFAKLITKINNQKTLYTAKYYFGRILAKSNKKEDIELAKELFTKLANKNSGYAKSSTKYIYQLNHLQIGMAAPEIKGENIEGEQMQLSDFRGKVVLLSFWGHW